MTFANTPASNPAAPSQPAENPSAELGLADTLRAKTHDLHVAAEHHPFQQRLLRGGMTTSELAGFINEMMHVQLALESALRSTSNASVRTLVREWHVRSHLSKHDVLALGGTPSPAPNHAATKKFCDVIGNAAERDPTALVGILYVLEGATNGNVYVGKALEKHLNLAPGTATRSFDPHGADQRPRWMAFRSELNGLALDQTTTAHVVEAARATFQAVYDISEAMNRPAAPTT
ncbi:MAG: biliverdin-producing heme oxygenase [Phycisphaerae bacterium]|nr:biliverdin-producing heme oxygenase [Phycisphaerae bacterium]